MNNSNRDLKQFRDKEHKELFEVLKKNKFLDNESAEDVIYAIYQISEHIEKIYSKLIPDMINNSNSSREKLIDIFDDIKFNFNEIRQLIETAKLTGLKYWDEDESS